MVLFDSFSGNTSLSASIPNDNYTLAHTCSGSDRFLLVAVYTSGGGTISSITYAGTAMSAITSFVESGSVKVYIYGLVNPASGNNNVVVTFTGSQSTGGIDAYSFSGVDQTTGYGAIATLAGSAHTNSISESITTTQDNSLLVDFFMDNRTVYSGSSPISGAGQTQKLSSSTSNGYWCGSSYERTTTAGSYSTSWTWNHVSSVTASLGVIEILPSTSLFPETTGAVTTSFASSVSSMPVNLPSSIASGDLLIAIAEVRNSGTWTLPSGWTQLFSPVAAGGVGDFTAFYRICDGTEGSTATWTASVASTASWQVRQITNWQGTTPPEVTTANSGGAVSTNNPPSLTPSWGADNTLWLAVMGDTAQTVSITGAPTNYDDLTSNSVSSGGSACNTGSAFRQTNTATEDPAGFTTGSDRWWMAATIAIRPVASAITTTQTTTATTRIQQSVLKTVAALARITTNTLKTVNAVTRITAATQKTQNAITRITTKSLKTVTSLTRITANTIKTQTARTRITVLTQKLQTATTRISVSTTKTITALARITANTLKTQIANARITANTIKTNSAITRITVSVQKTQTAITRILNVVPRTITATTRITANTLKTNSAITRIANIQNKTIGAVTRLSTRATKTINAITRITVNILKTQTAKTRITANTLRVQGSITRIARVVNKTQTSITRIALLSSKTIDAVTRITANTLKIVTSTTRLTANGIKTNTATTRIQQMVLKTQFALARISVSTTKTILSVTRITAHGIRTTSAITRLSTRVQKTINGVSRITVFATQNNHAITRITIHTLKTIAAITRINSIIRKNTTASASISTKTLHTTTATAIIISSRKRFIVKPIPDSQKQALYNLLRSYDQNSDLYKIRRLPYYN